MVTLVFWALLYPGISEEYNLYLRSYTTHGGACLLIFGDFMINSIIVEKRHVYFITGIMVCYSIEMLTVKYTLGWALYFFATLDSPISWFISFMAGATFSGAHLIFVQVSTCLHSKNLAKTQAP